MEDTQIVFFQRLWDEHRRNLERYARHFLRNSALQEEVVQETYLTAFQHLDKLHTHPNPGGWLMVTLKNMVLRKVEEEVRQSKLIAESRAPCDLSLGLDELFPASLPEPDRRLLKLYYEDGYTISELTKHLHLTSESKCKMDLYYARQRLKAALSKGPQWWRRRRGGL